MSTVQSKRPKCQYCSEKATVWSPSHGATCKFFDENGFCKEDGKVCPKCNRLVSRLKPMYFLGGPEVCFNCRDEEWSDVM